MLRYEQALDIPRFNSGDKRRAPQMAFAFARLACKDMALAHFVAFDFSRCGELESLPRAAV